MDNLSSKEQELAYLAGLFDGEGSFSLGFRIVGDHEYVNFSPRASMTLRYGTDVLGRYKDIFGGSISEYDNGAVRWTGCGQDTCKKVAEELMPYLRIKKDIADKFLEMLSYFPDTNARRKKVSSNKKTWKAGEVRKVAEIGFNLNPQTKNRSKFTWQDVEKVIENYPTNYDEQ